MYCVVMDTVILVFWEGVCVAITVFSRLHNCLCAWYTAPMQHMSHILEMPQIHVCVFLLGKQLSNCCRGC